MAKWRFEPGHTAVEFCVRHMMGCCVRGNLKNIPGTLEFDPEHPESSSVEVTIDAAALWSGDQERDNHLRSDHFLDVANHPYITFKSTAVQLTAGTEARITGDLQIRGV